jgi:hypothetical protein
MVECGSMTLYAMTHSNRFRDGVSVTPVTNARNYDSIYMERYYGQLKDDPEGYDQSDVTKADTNLHGALLLVHGPGDDNVHFQNSVQMIDAPDCGGQAIPANDLSQQDAQHLRSRCAHPPVPPDSGTL